MHDIICIGSATRDVLLEAEGFELRKHADSPTGVEQCFPLGSKIEIKKIVFTTGGGGTNAAVTFGRQGFKTACIGVIGEDAAGEEIVDELKKEGVEPLFQKHSDDLTAYSVILVHPNAERTILSYKGEGQHFDVNKVPFDKLRAKWFYVNSLGGHYDLLDALISHAIKGETKIAFNPGGKELAHGLEKLKPLLEHIDIFAVNKEEAAGLFGVKLEEEEELFKKFRDVCSGIFILTDGHNGVQVCFDGKKYSAGVPDSPIVERTGAGDAFNSGFVCEYIKSGDIKKAIQFATANASSVVTKWGAKAGILKKGDWGPWPLVEVVER
ncbi:MAG: carbohydrate kinase family protein [Patescibacteria group bacterium]